MYLVHVFNWGNDLHLGVNLQLVLFIIDFFFSNSTEDLPGVSGRNIASSNAAFRSLFAWCSTYVECNFKLFIQSFCDLHLCKDILFTKTLRSPR